MGEAHAVTARHWSAGSPPVVNSRPQYVLGAVENLPILQECRAARENIWGCGCNSVQGTPSALGLPERPSSLLSGSHGKALWISNCWEAVGHEAEFEDVSCIYLSLPGGLGAFLYQLGGLRQTLGTLAKAACEPGLGP